MPSRSARPSLADAHRVVRRIEPPDAPYPGVLAREGDSAVFLVGTASVDALDVCDPGDPHVLSAHDIESDAAEQSRWWVLPWCPESLAAFLRRRVDAGALLAAGEAVTVAVCLQRAVRAERQRGTDWAGHWWLTDAGRPVFARTPSGQSLTAQSRAILTILADAVDDPELAAQLLCVLDGAEEDIVSFALPAPLDRELGQETPAHPRAVDGEGIVSEDGPSTDDGGSLLTLWRRAAESDAVGALRSLGGLVRARFERRSLAVSSRSIRRTTRRRSAAIAASAAAAVLLVGLMWPQESEATSGDERRASASAATAEPHRPPATPSSATASPADRTPGAPEPLRAADAVDALEALLKVAADCGADDACRAGVFAEPAPTGSRLPAPGARIEILDDLGDIVVLGVADASDEEYFVALVRGDTGWRIRSAHRAQNE